MANKNRHFIIEFTERTIKLWSFSQKIGEQVSLLEETPFGGQGGLSPSKVLDAFEERHHFKKCPVSLILPRADFVVRFLDFPEASREELKNMLELQLGSMLPYDLNEIRFDFLFYPNKQNPGKVVVILFIINLNVLTKYLNLLTSLGIKPRLVLPSTICILAAYLKKISIDLSEAVVFLDFDQRGHVEIIATVDRRIVLTRTLRYESGNEVEFLEQLSFSLQKAQLEFQNMPIRRVVTNHQLAFHNMKERIREILPEAQFSLVGRQEFSELDLTRFQDGFQTLVPTSGVGFSYVGEENQLNFLTEKLEKEYETASFFESFKKLGFFFSIFLLSLGVFVGVDYLLKQDQLSQIETKLKEIKQDATEAKKWVQAAEEYDALSEGKVLGIQLLHEVYTVIPSGIFLTYFDYNADEGLKIRGMAKTVAEVSDLLIQFQASAFFENAEIKFAKKRVENGETFTDFQIDCVVKGVDIKMISKYLDQKNNKTVVLLVLVVLLLVYIVVIHPILTKWFQLDELIDRKKDQLEKRMVLLERVETNKDAYEKMYQSLLVDKTLGSDKIYASFLSDIEKQVASVGLQIVDVEVLPVSEGESKITFLIQTELEGNMDQLVNLLYAIATNQDSIQIQNLTIERKNVQSETLVVRSVFAKVKLS